MAHFTLPSVLAPFVSSAPVRGTREQCNAYCSVIIDGAVRECTRRMNAVLQQPEQPHDVTDTTSAMRHLGKVARQLNIPDETLAHHAENIQPLYTLAASDHATDNERNRQTVHELAKNYATCHAYAHAIRDAIHAATTARQKRASSAAATTLHDTDPVDILVDDDARFVLSSDDAFDWAALEAENEED